MIRQLLLYFHTLKYLRRKQIAYRVFYAFKSKIEGRPKIISSPRVEDSTNWIRFPEKPKSYNGKGEFLFLNRGKKFESKIDWNYRYFGKLWTYNLCYFDFINEYNSEQDFASPMNDFANKYVSIKDGLEPYPTSLRIINWVKYLSANPNRDCLLYSVIFTDLNRLSRRLEYHLMGNHLLENGFALLIGGVFTDQPQFIALGKRILEEELNEQILADGGHFELSPMYHQIILERLLDTINCVNGYHSLSSSFKNLLTKKAGLMLGWLERMSFQNDDIPRVSDAVEGIALYKKDLFAYAERLGIDSEKIVLGASGYRKICLDDMEVLVDVGPLGATYIPGHAHDDLLSFLIHWKGHPLLVDPGISSYECDFHRKFERSKSAHNTVYVHSTKGSEMWGAFRVARRESCKIVSEEEDFLEACCFGITGMKKSFTRSFELVDNQLLVKDQLAYAGTGTASFHFHPEVSFTVDEFSLEGDFGTISFEGAKNIKDLAYNYAEGFNSRVTARAIEVEFETNLESRFHLR